MRLEIDFSRLEQVAGHSKWLNAVGAAFLEQIPQWYRDFDAATSKQCARVQFQLLHKIKGSCYAVGAYDLAGLITAAEAEKVLGKTLTVEVLFSRLAQVEAELRAFCDKS